MCRSFAAFAALVAALPCVLGTQKGAIKLDSWTYEKFLSLPGQKVLVKFDKAYAYGDTEDAFKSLCEKVSKHSSFFVAEVPIAEYGDKENDDLRERYSLKKDDYPVYKLVTTGPNFDEKAVNYTGDKTARDLVRFLRTNGIRITGVGGLKEYDELAEKFITKTSEADRKAVLDAAQTKAGGEEDTDVKNKAEMYVKTMKKIVEKGLDYVNTETERVAKVLGGKMSDDKKKQMEVKLDVLSSFEGVKVHEEL
ncbi:unnamed protein product [Vitrella brassicaformis CCMP3155]|uniref:Endoplasmic reticulum resident protein 29 C-terminal domain-containing protein n=1 Tax=Vitrella brassicaformis (strain CCMP3155) TaxID=1169540 RepID=A0A0G4E9X1_VITBC|nr:unnamed protein product [Vitrella brassicaformis CCMP3155]|eukprot:CEL91990.1 unnamed protein product [Vitrella brassicaformis CCMP3155]